MSDPTELEALDRLMAEKVVGVAFRIGAPEEQFCREYGNEGEWFQWPGDRRWSCYKCQWDFKPSLRIEQAMECVDKVLAEHPTWAFDLTYNPSDKRWLATFWEWGGAKNNYQVDIGTGEANDCAKAICRALKEAMGGQMTASS